MAEIGRRKGDAAFLLALAAGKTVREAAEAAGIGERTATRRVAEPDFRRQVAELRGEMVGRALGRMADGMTEAADTLRKLLAAESESVRLGAARSVLELGVKLRESVELEERLVNLERQFNHDHPTPTSANGSGNRAMPTARTQTQSDG